jgi:3,4-dihydroxy 2-butanone 4-phosphate synthase / GTP cyclohydrolase II
MPLSPIPEIINELKAGRFIIIVDDENRENEGDLAIAAEKVTPEIINFMVTNARGLVCLPIISKRLDDLQIPPMVQENTSKFTTAFAVSIEAKNTTTSGISAFDRAATVKAVIDPKSKPEDIARPGHIFPLRAREGGVLVRAGHTEAIVDMARMAGLYPAGVICEILNDDGTMARLPDLIKMAKKLNIKIASIADLITYRRREEKLVQRVAEAKFPTKYGDFTIMAYKSTVDTDEHVALVMGNVRDGKPVLVRVHSECVTGDVLGSMRCDCGDQVQMAMKMIGKEGRGVFLYMRQEGRGIGLHNKLKAYALQDKGMDTVEANIALGFEADLRDYGIGAQILADLGLHDIKLLTNNPKKIIGLESYGLKVIESIRLLVKPTEHNKTYLRTKKEKMEHLLTIED